MEKEETGYEKCRFCGASTDLLVPIAAGEGIELGLEAKIKSYLPLEFSPADSLPQSACYPCVEHLLAWDSFVSCCIDIDTKHRSYLITSEECKVEDSMDISADPTFSDSDNEPLTTKITKLGMGKDENGLFPCNTCGKEFDRKQSLIAHARACKEKFECDLCKNVYKTSTNLKKHKEREHNTDQSKCVICCKIMSSKKLPLHLKTAHAVKRIDDEKERFKCKLCDQYFKSKFVRTDHMKEVHYKEKIKCDKCNFEGLRLVVKRHSRNVHAEKRYPCKLCSYSFKTHHLLKTHMAAHSELRSFICDICGMGFKRLNNVRDHMKCHQEKSNQCQICGKFFSRKRYLAVHQKTIHDFYADGSVPEERGFECGTCGAKLKWKQNLMAHMRIHTGEKPYACKICKKSFVCHGSLRSHMNKHDLARNDAPEGGADQKIVFPVMNQFNSA